MTPPTTAPAAGTESSAAAKNQVRGRFEVTMQPQAIADAEAAATLGRRSLDKRYHGALDATGRGEMLSAMGSVSGSASYVAMEVVTGSLDGRAGSFALQHSGTMDRGAKNLSITVVPDSGTGALAGLSGRMDIVITGGEHFYEFEYGLAPQPAAASAG